MEEHFQAYFAWKAAQLRDQWCWHVDAHLDIGKTGLGEKRLEILRACTTAQEAQNAGVLGNSYLPWGGLHCGNYLYPAIREGIVSRLTWVIPPGLPEGGTLLTWARSHINAWFDLELSEYASLRIEDGCVVGQLLGIPFELGTLENLPLPSTPVLLDIDLDYFLHENGDSWQDPRDFQRAIAQLPVELATLAFSVKGGFTPDSQRELARAFVSDTAGYQSSELDHLASQVRCHHYEQALDSVANLLSRETVESSFLHGTALQALERKEEALALWQGLLKQAEALGQDGQAYVHCLCSELCNELERPEEALEHAVAGQSFEPENYKLLWNEAVALESLGEARRVAKTLRKTVKLSEAYLFGLRARYALSHLYSRQGKEGLAKIELQKLAQNDVTGRYRPVTLLG